MTMKYKIRHKVTGLFSEGGTYMDIGDGMHPSRWSKEGKIWNSIGALRNHLAIYCEWRYDYTTRTRVRINKVPDAWEVVEFEMVETNAYSAKDTVKK